MLIHLHEQLQCIVYMSVNCSTENSSNNTYFLHKL